METLGIRKWFSSHTSPPLPVELVATWGAEAMADGELVSCCGTKKVKPRIIVANPVHEELLQDDGPLTDDGPAQCESKVYPSLCGPGLAVFCCLSLCVIALLGYVVYLLWLEPHAPSRAPVVQAPPLEMLQCTLDQRSVCPKDWQHGLSGGYRCLSAGQKRLGAACRRKQDGQFPYVDCQRQCSIGKV
ncbi:hypothetical protein AK812_SmicGene24264 [Symbiodinium microadriaticum]|uniref:Uncharacterized protein n=1 Tax=Symbiodinium microadriaticum TaxID=2951 RepID=A0A1Q9DF27_SYMMI|nr:hypothetical protein AK812_SmicGene24264 [Symbiodinium microadriaticum]